MARVSIRLRSPRTRMHTRAGRTGTLTSSEGATSVRPRHTWYRVPLAFIIVAFGAASAVYAQNEQSPFPPIGYTRVYCYCPPGGFCDAFCGSPSASYVTALVDTEGPYDWSPAWSPDATAMAYVSGNEIIVADLMGAVNITNTAAAESFP